MKFLIVVAACLAVAAAFPEARQKRSAVLSYAAAPGTVVQGPSAVISGPSGTIVSDTGAISTGLSAGVVAAPAAYAALPSAYAALPSAYAALPSAYAASPLAYSAYAPLAHTAYAYGGAPTVLAAPNGITAGAVVAPGTTLVGPSTNGAPGAVITNRLAYL